ncbi:MAG: ankyrin repeat domain-containing protein, partial [Bdellovibrionia bacterium]
LSSRDVAKVKALLDQGADPNTEYLYGPPAIFGVARSSDKISLDMLKLLLAYGANVNAKDFEGNSALHHLNHDDSLPAFKVLIEAKIDVNAKNNQGNSPILAMVMGGERIEINVLEALRKASADLGAKDREGYSAALWSFGCEESVRALLAEYDETLEHAKERGERERRQEIDSRKEIAQRIKSVAEYQQRLAKQKEIEKATKEFYKNSVPCPKYSAAAWCEIVNGVLIQHD